MNIGIFTITLFFYINYISIFYFFVILTYPAVPGGAQGNVPHVPPPAPPKTPLRYPLQAAPAEGKVKSLRRKLFYFDLT